MKAIVYTSEMTGSPAARTQLLTEIVSHSGPANAKRGVTGAMLMVDVRFLQIIEGDDSIIDELFGKIARDVRHNNMKVLFQEHIDQRSFPKWSMEGFQTDDLTAFSELSLERIKQVYSQNFAFEGQAFLDVLKSIFDDAAARQAILSN